MRRFDASPGQGRMPPATSARFVGFPDTAELPIYLTPLLGREADVARVCSLFREARLVSLVGAGHRAAEPARQRHEHAHGLPAARCADLRAAGGRLPR